MQQQHIKISIVNGKWLSIPGSIDFAIVIFKYFTIVQPN